jgi:hypothetical protein
LILKIDNIEEANRFDSDFAFKKTKKNELSFFLITKGKKRKGSIVNYRRFAITSGDGRALLETDGEGGARSAKALQL